MKDIVINSLVKNFKDDFGFEPSFTIKQYSQFDNLLRSTLRDKAKINQLREEKLKTEAKLSDLKNRDFWNEMTHAFTVVFAIINVVLTIINLTNSVNTKMLCIIFGELFLFTAFAGYAIVCGKKIERRINYYNIKLDLLNEILKSHSTKSRKIKASIKKQV